MMWLWKFCSAHSYKKQREKNWGSTMGVDLSMVNHCPRHARQNNVLYQSIANILSRAVLLPLHSNSYKDTANLQKLTRAFAHLNLNRAHVCLRPLRHRVGRLISHSKQMNGAVNSRSSCFCLVSVRENRYSILLRLPFFFFLILPCHYESLGTFSICQSMLFFCSASLVCMKEREKKTRRQQREPYSDVVQDGKAIPVYTLLCTGRTHSLSLVSEMTRAAQRRRGSFCHTQPKESE